jgi:hypothetical protein
MPGIPILSAKLRAEYVHNVSVSHNSLEVKAWFNLALCCNPAPQPVLHTGTADIPQLQLSSKSLRNGRLNRD